LFWDSGAFSGKARQGEKNEYFCEKYDPMAFKFFHTPKPKQFEIKPRYYDPKKEELEQRKRELGLTDSSDPELRLRSQMQQRWRNERRDARKKSSSQRLFIFILLALILIYLLFLRK